MPSSPPDILQYNDVRALLYHARDTPSQAAPDTPSSRREGWRKICLFALYFECSALEVPSPPDGTLGGAARFFRSAFPEEVPPEARRLGWAGFLAWRWRPTWQGAFERLRGGGRPIVPPILQVRLFLFQPILQESLFLFSPFRIRAFSFSAHSAGAPFFFLALSAGELFPPILQVRLSRPSCR